ncbi:MAG: aminotransferase class IV [Prevotella sp.]|uniref:aminotransferase class IV n=1 Tax=Prevotella sp. TaxID=59823 RepID=UPI002A30541E|nr:aminotransferase class IV [Prevotella sp.]MDD7317948.1 aminotransferase class IV [Prevotellaceae bacterium]MDY4020839.1 aminotransferase class IV [Prevotella sp.]
MCRFIETIKVADGEIINFERHEQRVMITAEHFWNKRLHIDRERLETLAKASEGISKLRFIYDRNGVRDITCTPYRMRRISKLVLADGKGIDYSFKYEDRGMFRGIRGNAAEDREVLIVKDGMITDTTYTNVAFYDGRRWVTPRKPLLSGTKRALLLDKGLVTEGDIAASDIGKYQNIAFFNAMIELGEAVLPISAITT